MITPENLTSSQYRNPGETNTYTPHTPNKRTLSSHLPRRQVNKDMLLHQQTNPQQLLVSLSSLLRLHHPEPPPHTAKLHNANRSDPHTQRIQPITNSRMPKRNTSATTQRPQPS